MNDFRKLIVWQKAIELIVAIYKMTSLLPKEEKFGIVSQIQRAAVSISCNISEGCGKTSKKDFNRFLEMSLGSAYEVENLLIVCREINYLSKEETEKLITQTQEVERMLIGLKKNLN